MICAPPDTVYKADTLAYFASHVVADSKTGCWLWTGSRDKAGYALANRWMLRQGKWRSILAHRLSYSIFNGEIPPTMHVLHSCDNPRCVSPSHLTIGTHTDNMRDKARKGRCPKFDGSGNPSAKLTDKNVRDIRRMLSEGKTQTSIAKMFGMSQSTISLIALGKHWSSVKD